METLHALLTSLSAAEDAARTELLRMYPLGSQLGFTIMHGQRTPSTGTVVSDGWRAGYLRVDHHQAKPDGRYRYREVHYKSIVTPNVELSGPPR